MSAIPTEAGANANIAGLPRLAQAV